MNNIDLLKTVFIDGKADLIVSYIIKLCYEDNIIILLISALLGYAVKTIVRNIPDP